MADAYDAPEPSSRRSDESVLKELRDRYDYGCDAWREIREEGKTDMRYVSGDPWPDKERAKRQDAGRPCLSLDELGQYVNQTINEVRQHKRAIHVTPQGYGATDESAKLRASLIRQIEYRSNAQIAYTTAFENTVQRSYGFFGIKARFESERSFEQELVIHPYVNPDLVTLDPDGQMPDGSDAKWAFVAEVWKISDFKRRWPKAKVQDFSTDYQQTARRWFPDAQTVVVAEYWSIESESRELLLVQGPNGPQPVFFDELKPPKNADPVTAQKWQQTFAPLIGAPALKHRTVEYPRVIKRLTNGLELLPVVRGQEDTEQQWPGKFIPIVACYGKVMYVDDGSGAERKILSLVRLARDPQMLYCYYRTAEAEQVGMSTKFPYFVYEGQLSAVQKTALAQSVHEPVAFIEVKAITDEVPSGPLPLPQRNPFEPAIQALEVGAEGARRAIQSAMGMSPLPTQAQRRNEKSGIALQKMEDSAQKGSFHFLDHYEMAITRAGVILDDLLPHYYDAARQVTLRTPADETKVATINNPAVSDEETGQPLMIGEGIHDITLSTGPSYDSEREAASDFADALAQNAQVFPLIADLVVKLKNLGPIGDEIAERLRAMLPPPVQQVINGQKETPEALRAKLQQAMQALDVISKELQAKTQVVETDQVKAQQSMAVEQMRQEFELKRDELKANAEAQIKVAELSAKQQLELRKLEVELELGLAKIGSAESMKRGEIEQEQLHQHGEALMQAQELGAEDKQAELDRQADRDKQTQEQAFAASEAERNRQAAQESSASE